uniref:Uncharacterized protein n=1 Tax=Anguilla anguilla TaxID=7936 RepID=A0A0E9UTV3_ANGAN
MKCAKQVLPGNSCCSRSIGQPQ